MFTRFQQSYYYYDRPEQGRKFFFAKCIHESTFGAFKPVNPMTHKSFTQVLLYSLVGLFISLAIYFIVIFFQKMPYGYSICTIFFATVGFLYFYFVFALYRKAYRLYEENPQYALEYNKWQKKILDEHRDSQSTTSPRQVLFTALQADSVLKLYFEDITKVSKEKAFTQRIIAVIALVSLSVFTVIIEHLSMM